MDAQKTITFVLSALLFVAACAQAAVPLRSRSTCLDALTNKVYSKGDTWFTAGDRECMKLTCDGDDTISGLTCAQFQVPSWCSVKPGNMQAVYPDCCPTPVCPEENSIADSTGLGDVAAVAPSGPYGGYPYPPAY